jgi:hypothetical protein
MSAPLSPTVKAGRLIRLLGWFYLVAPLLLGVFLLAEGEPWPFDLWDLPWLALLTAFALAYLKVGTGVKREAAWARTPAIVLLVLSLLTIPIGTIISAIALFYLSRASYEPNVVA